MNKNKFLKTVNQTFKTNTRNCIVILILVFNLSSCNSKNNKKDTNEITENVLTDLMVDHFNIWVKNPKKAKELLTNIGFTAVPDSLSQIHKGQGTTGRYFYFLNGYLELIFVYNQNEFDKNNSIHKDLDFVERANFDKNGASPFGIALKVKEYNIEKIPFKKVSYHQDWMEENANIYAAKNSKKNLKEPSVFVVYPEIEWQRFETLADLKNIPDEYAIWREFYKHKNGAKKITDIIITSNDLDVKTETIKAVNGIKNIIVKKGKEHLMELYFDHNIQGKSYDLRPELPLVINL